MRVDVGPLTGAALVQTWHLDVAAVAAAAVVGGGYAWCYRRSRHSGESVGRAQAVCVGVGSTFLILGLLRALQRIAWFNSPTQRDGWHGSWLVYVIALAAGLVLMGLAGLVALRSTRRKEAAR